MSVIGASVILAASSACSIDPHVLACCFATDWLQTSRRVKATRFMARTIEFLWINAAIVKHGER